MSSQVTQSDKTVLVKIDKLVHGGKGLAHDGSLAIFVEGVLPGESVRIQLERVKKGYVEGRLLEVVTSRRRPSTYPFLTRSSWMRTDSPGSTPSTKIASDPSCASPLPPWTSLSILTRTVLSD